MKNGDHTDQKRILTNSFKWKIGLILKYHIHVLYTLKQQNAKSQSICVSETRGKSSKLAKPGTCFGGWGIYRTPSHFYMSDEYQCGTIPFPFRK